MVTPTCLSSSYVGYGAIRILPTFMILGQSAGCAAVLAAKNGIAIQDIDYAELKKVLALSGQILEIPQDWLEIITSVN